MNVFLPMVSQNPLEAVADIHRGQSDGSRKDPRTTGSVVPSGVGTMLPIPLYRPGSVAVSEQIRLWISSAIRDGRLAAGARLPSWRDLAVQLGVARGTVRVAYERLADEQLIVACGPAGTFVADCIPVATAVGAVEALNLPTHPVVSDLRLTYDANPRPFQMGVPAHDAFPIAVWSRLVARSARTVADHGVYNPDPQGELLLRREIAAHLSIARGVRCTADQIFVTNGHAGALGLVLRALDVRGEKAWVEEPGYPATRVALELSGLTCHPVPVDDEGLVVQDGISSAGDAALAVVTSGQQAPLGMALSLPRRHKLLQWAARTSAWIIDDDYLSELQLRGRAAPALASLDSHGRVIHFGSFSKTINPALRLGFVVAPASLVPAFTNIATALCPASAVATQHSVAEFLREGHYLRHLRRMKRLYVHRRDAVKSALDGRIPVEAMAGLALILRLPGGAHDREVARHAAAAGLAPVALSPWYSRPDHRHQGLLLGITNITEDKVVDHCALLNKLIHQETPQ
ncbi:GntR family transcriptional regulator/MocR family aminotransferase [Mycobacterium frederiksbergense]|uniref:GntR family transcriptional regulator/MocR family aminotransferase n=1 Tax=Mycolicibacterium frederiksbergense TaxID=117567 RepID=A0ABT6KZC9_9MYCO|nr:PLP-dependent aminotransferase family protein [Mycolicibacterium frederiksbergense]MDH6196041.1 GntR family transcriptional regulator/MocR family aminotransferase [Mycolicibacterium frederiksbergense]